ncbi:uncharacterized protein LOC110875650 [Helianthus annuus]|uniref:uncharacterized protein LOC110875650 n=1 Tax=Helianthus annuus TaxID=4232 RepID=UPI000B8F8FA9|nr:uncharacterized protein LOC110875650 [Helianthus annuus]
MNWASLNVKGAGGLGKASLVRSLLKENNISFLALQETQMCNLTEARIRKFWDGSTMEYIKFDASGRSGGIVSIWNPGLFKKDMEMVDRNFIMVRGELIGAGIEISVINVYAQSTGTERRRLWNSLLSILDELQGLCLLIRDFNEVRVPEDRWNSNFDSNNALHFNNFIGSAGLLEYPMSGRSWLDIPGLEEVVKKGLGCHGNERFKDQLLGCKLKGVKDEAKNGEKHAKRPKKKNSLKRSIK